MKTILFIEDNIEIRENITEFLELEGFAVLTAENGNEGIDMAKSNIPDLILCDVLMPLVTGYEVLTQLKKHQATSEIPFIFVSASTEKKDIQVGLDMGADGYIRKPFEMEELLLEIGKVIE